MPPPSANFFRDQKHWVIGIVVALTGALLARGVSPNLESDGMRFAVLILGHTTSLLGLFIIARGVFLRHKEEDTENSD